MLQTSPQPKPLLVSVEGHQGYKFVYGQDEIAARWCFQQWKCYPQQFNMAVAIIDADNQIVGAFIFSQWNGSNILVQFCGKGMLKRQIMLHIVKIAVNGFKVNRLTLHTHKESMARGLLKLGAIYEVTMKRMMGSTDDPTHEAKQFVFYKEQLERFLDPKKDM